MIKSKLNERTGPRGKNPQTQWNHSVGTNKLWILSLTETNVAPVGPAQDGSAIAKFLSFLREVQGWQTTQAIPYKFKWNLTGLLYLVKCHLNNTFISLVGVKDSIWSQQKTELRKEWEKNISCKVLQKLNCIWKTL